MGKEFQPKSFIFFFLLIIIGKINAQSPHCDIGLTVKINDTIINCMSNGIPVSKINSLHIKIDSNRAVSLNYYNSNSIKNIVTQLKDSLFVMQTFAFRNKISTHTEYIKSGQDSISANGLKYVFYPNGGLHYIYNYKNGILEGRYISYWENGFLQAVGSYKNNEKVGLWNYYYANGKFQKSITFRPL